MMCHQTVWLQKNQQFRRNSRSYFDHMSPCCDLDLENSKPIFLHALRLMMMHQNTKFGNKMFRGLEDIIWTNTNIFTHHCDLDTECSNPFFFFSQDTVAYDDVSSDHVWLPKNQQFNRFSRKSHILTQMNPRCDLDLKNTKQFFPRMTLQFMMLHHHTMFGNKMFCGSEDIRTNIHWHLEPFLLLWPWPQQSNPIFSKDSPAYDEVPSNQV